MSNLVSDVVSDEQLSCIIQIESGGNPKAKAPTSSALGLGQFLNGTWLGLVQKHHPEWMRGASQAGVLVRRTDPADSIEMLAWLCEDNVNVLGAGWGDGDLYLAHFLGAGTARKVLRANGATAVGPIVGEKAVEANESILRGKTCQQVRTWANTKMAKARGHNWVDKYWPNKAADVLEDIPEDAVATKVDDLSSVVADATQAPTDPTPHGEVNDGIANLQKALVKMGYNEVGIINGAWGGGTKAGIAAFLNDRGRDDLPSDMSQPVLDEVAKAGLEDFHRKASEERANIKPKDLAQYNPTMLATLRTKAVAFWGSVVSGVLFVYNALASEFTSLWTTIGPLRRGLENVPGVVWIAVVGAGCVLLYLNAHRAERDTTEAFQTRRLLR